MLLLHFLPLVLGLVGFFDFNLVSYLLGSGQFAQQIYILVGISAGYLLVTMYSCRKKNYITRQNPTNRKSHFVLLKDGRDYYSDNLEDYLSELEGIYDKYKAIVDENI